MSNSRSRSFIHMSLFVVCSTFATVYAVTSFILFRKPHWLHTKRHPAFIVRHIAHRGGKSICYLIENEILILLIKLGAGESIENSLLAFDKSDKNDLRFDE
jgi:hypothetical protein